MPAQYVSFVVRLLVSDEQDWSGRLYCVPEQDGQYFRDWDTLLALMQLYLRSRLDEQTPPLTELGPS